MPSGAPRCRCLRDEVFIVIVIVIVPTGKREAPGEMVTIIKYLPTYLESVRVLVARPATCVGVEQETLLVLVADVVVHVLCNGKLTMELYIYM